MTPEQSEKVSALTPAQIGAIDDALLRQVSSDWRKIARIVGTAMMEQSDRVSGVPDIYYAQRLRRFVETARLEAQGNATVMRLGEVRLVSTGTGNAT